MTRLPPAEPKKSDWDLDLTTGEIAEETLRRILTHKSPEGHVFVEVKTDRQLQRTGNLFIEYECRGKPSGLAATKATWWAFTAEAHGQNIFKLVRVSWLKARLKQLLDVGKAFGDIKGGDDWASRGVLVKIQDLWQDTE